MLQQGVRPERRALSDSAILQRATQLLVLLVFALRLAAVEAGYPVLRTFHPEDYAGAAQNFAFAQGLDGVIYVGNLKGLITYDGAWWKSVILPNESGVFGIAVNDTGVVALSGYNEFGVLAIAADGTTTYRSLVDTLPPERREVGDIRTVYAIGPTFYAISQKAVYVSDGTKMSLLATLPAAVKGTPRSFVADRAIHLAVGTKLMRLGSSGNLAEILDAGAPIEAGVVTPDSGIFLAVAGRGLQAVSGGRLVPVAPEVSAWLSTRAVQSMLLLSDGRIAIATRFDGVVIVNRGGTVDQLLDARAGLPKAAFHTFFCDRDGGLWIGTGGAIQRVDVASAVTLVDERNGLARMVETITRHDGVLYAATERGVYQINGDAIVGNAVATLVAGFNQRFWSLLSFDDELLAGSSGGIYTIGKDRTPRLIDGTAELVAYELTRSRRDPSRVWVGTREGAVTLTRTTGGWVVGPVVAGIPRYPRSFEEIGDVLWCGTTFNGVVRYDLRTGEARQLGTGEMSVSQAGGKLLIGMERQPLMTVTADERTIVPDERFGSPGAEAFKTAADSHGNVWANGMPPRVFSRKSDGSFDREGVLVSAVGNAHVSSFFSEPDGVVWLGSDRGVYRIVTNRLATAPAPRPLIRRVTSGDRLLAAEGGVRARPAIPYSFARLRFEFAAADYIPSAQYQFRLDPSELQWSKPSAQPFTEFTNLSEGSYTFRVRTISANGRVGPETTWAFTVQPPWYRTRITYLASLLLLLLAVWLYVKVRTRNLRRRAAALQATVDERTAELRKRVIELDEAQKQLVRQNELLDSANRTLEALSLIDGLTSVANRRLFDKAFAEEWRRAWRSGAPVSLLMIDLDHFKDLNDRYGHPVGDDCLRATAALLRDVVRRSGDIVARYGGEEFAVLLPDTDLDGALLLAEQIRRGIERMRFMHNDREFSVTTSIGAAALVPKDDNGSLLIQLADAALYEAKRSGRNRVCHSLSEEGGAIAVSSST